ncbi:MAG: sulfatase [Spirochaeta sp.]|jgi:iduronate 2-sulfatase|nr:sulfatase [Spirochaeta sp.]
MSQFNGPNVLFLISHDIGRRFSTYGNKETATPVIDEFVQGAFRFHNHYCQWPLCGPSRANLFTGCRPPTTQRYDNRPFFGEFRERTGYSPATLPEAFGNAGYTTRAFGFVYHDAVDEPSWNAGHRQIPEWSDRNDGFDDVPERLRRGWRTREAKELIARRWKALEADGVTEEQLDDPATERRARGPAVERYDGPDTGYPDGVVAEAAAEWLLRRDDGAGGPGYQPFFLAVGFISGHTPFRAPARDWDRYDRASLTLPPYREPPVGSPEWASGDSEPSQFYTTDGYTKPWRADEAQSRELLHGHYATVSYTDRQVGIILTALKESGHAEDTIVVITSDHGFHDGHHGYWGKHNLWEQSLQVPLYVRLPGRSGGRIDAMTEHIDLFPTLCRLAGLPVPDHVEGTSFAELLTGGSDTHHGAGQPETAKDRVYAHRRHMWHDRIQAYAEAHTVRTKRYRYTCYLDEQRDTVHEELFDYIEDPEERYNLLVDTGNVTKPPDNLVSELRVDVRRFRL